MPDSTGTPCALHRYEPTWFDGEGSLDLTQVTPYVTLAAELQRVLRWLSPRDEEQLARIRDLAPRVGSRDLREKLELMKPIAGPAPAPELGVRVEDRPFARVLDALTSICGEDFASGFSEFVDALELENAGVEKETRGLRCLPRFVWHGLYRARETEVAPGSAPPRTNIPRTVALLGGCAGRVAGQPPGRAGPALLTPCSLHQARAFAWQQMERASEPGEEGRREERGGLRLFWEVDARHGVREVEQAVFGLARKVRACSEVYLIWVGDPVDLCCRRPRCHLVLLCAAWHFYARFEQILSLLRDDLPAVPAPMAGPPSERTAAAIWLGVREVVISVRDRLADSFFELRQPSFVSPGPSGNSTGIDSSADLKKYKQSTQRLAGVLSKLLLEGPSSQTVDDLETVMDTGAELERLMDHSRFSQTMSVFSLEQQSIVSLTQHLATEAFDTSMEKWQSAAFVRLLKSHVDSHRLRSMLVRAVPTNQFDPSDIHWDKAYSEVVEDVVEHLVRRRLVDHTLFDALMQEPGLADPVERIRTIVLGSRRLGARIILEYEHDGRRSVLGRSGEVRRGGGLHVFIASEMPAWCGLAVLACDSHGRVVEVVLLHPRTVDEAEDEAVQARGLLPAGTWIRLTPREGLGEEDGAVVRWRVGVFLCAHPTTDIFATWEGSHLSHRDPRFLDWVRSVETSLPPAVETSRLMAERLPRELAPSHHLSADDVGKAVVYVEDPAQSGWTCWTEMRFQ